MPRLCSNVRSCTVSGWNGSKIRLSKFIGEMGAAFDPTDKTVPPFCPPLTSRFLTVRTLPENWQRRAHKGEDTADLTDAQIGEPCGQRCGEL